MPDPIDVGVGARIRIRRRELGISQTELGDYLDLSFQQIQKYERGANRVSASMLVRVAQKLGCSVAFLIGEEEGAAGHLDGGRLAKLAQHGVAELVDAFTAIKSRGVRASVVRLVQGIAEGEDQTDETVE